jgi:hypothetical protein
VQSRKVGFPRRISDFPQDYRPNIQQLLQWQTFQQKRNETCSADRYISDDASSVQSKLVELAENSSSTGEFVEGDVVILVSLHPTTWRRGSTGRSKFANNNSIIPTRGLEGKQDD